MKYNLNQICTIYLNQNKKYGQLKKLWKRKNGSPLCENIPIHLAVAQNKYDEKALKEAIAKTMEIDKLNENGLTALETIVTNNKKSKFVEFLLKNNAKVPDSDNDKCLLLHFMIMSSAYCKKSIFLLVRYGMNIELKDESGFTPLYLSCMLGDVKLVQFFLKNNANVNVVDNFNKKTPLNWIIDEITFSNYQMEMEKWNKYIEILILLLQYGAKFGYKDYFIINVLNIVLTACNCFKLKHFIVINLIRWNEQYITEIKAMKIYKYYINFIDELLAMKKKEIKNNYFSYFMFLKCSDRQRIYYLRNNEIYNFMQNDLVNIYKKFPLYSYMLKEYFKVARRQIKVQFSILENPIIYKLLPLPIELLEYILKYFSYKHKSKFLKFLSI